MDKKESFGGELAKNLPIKDIYTDVAHPALSTVGKSLQGVVKIALTPVTALVWGYDKIASYLDVAIPEYFAKRKIAKEKIQSPDPSVAVPVMLALTYTSHKPELRDMFTNILGASMNKDCIDEHPAFVEIIKQLNPDECKFLRHLRQEQKMPMIKRRLKQDGGELDIEPFFSDICYLTKCEYPQKFPEYLDNLHRLGLVDVAYDCYLTDETFYNQLKAHPSLPKIVGVDNSKIIEKKSLFEMSALGKKFCSVCMD